MTGIVPPVLTSVHPAPRAVLYWMEMDLCIPAVMTARFPRRLSGVLSIQHLLVGAAGTALRVPAVHEATALGRKQALTARKHRAGVTHQRACIAGGELRPNEPLSDTKCQGVATTMVA
jgi:hypothetical protein